MQKIPVTRDGKSGSEVIIIDAADILKLEKIRNREVIVHTKTEQYYLDFTFDNLEEWLFEDGFRLLDNSSIVNVNHIKQYDMKKGSVILSTKQASAANIHREHIENIIQLLNTAQENATEEEVAKQDALFDKIMNETNDQEQLRSYATLRAVTERKRAEAKIVHMAYHDALTNLPNRLMFDQKLQECFEQARQDGTMLAVIFLDLDRFKVINDTLGHYVGDVLLQQVANKLKSYVSEDQIVARFGGDEFIILLNHLSTSEQAADFAQGIPGLLKEPFIIEGNELFVTSSIGISLYPNDGIDGETLLKNADIAMYRSKEKGGNSYHYYHPDMNKRSMHRLNLEVHLRKALERNEFQIYYQPIIDLKSGTVYGMEALVRWHHPEWGLVSPGEFIPLAEETGLIIPIGNWVLQESCRQNMVWQKSGAPPLVVSVNISAIQFHQVNFVQIVMDALNESKLPPELLCLEITENIAMNNVPHIVETMQKLKLLGVQISIDDFGTGYSSLSYLKRFRVQTLKIDQSFIRDVTHDEDNAAIVTALIAMSHRLKIKSLAEGVETKEQLDFLIQQGCNEIQGYVFSKPLPARDFELILKENKQLLQ